MYVFRFNLCEYQIIKRRCALLEQNRNREILWLHILEIIFLLFIFCMEFIVLPHECQSTFGYIINILTEVASSLKVRQDSFSFILVTSVSKKSENKSMIKSKTSVLCLLQNLACPFGECHHNQPVYVSRVHNFLHFSKDELFFFYFKKKKTLSSKNSKATSSSVNYRNYVGTSSQHKKEIFISYSYFRTFSCSSGAINHWV